ncbi:7tm 1 domain containing protein, partial [Asbolus verrucosus]
RERGERSSNQDLNRKILVGGEPNETANNESYLNGEYDVNEYDYLIRGKRDWDDDNFTYFNDSVNGTFSEEEFINSLWELISPKSWTWILIIFHTLVFVIGIIGNILVCVAVYRNHTMRTVTNYFIVNLAVADFLVILFCLPPSVVWDVTVTWFFGVAMCKIVLYFQGN